jgi:hypothetical protein
MSDMMKTTETTNRKRPVNGGGHGAVYGLGLIGALVFYWRAADGGMERLAAVGKAIVWPAFVVHDLLAHFAGRSADLDHPAAAHR